MNPAAPPLADLALSLAALLGLWSLDRVLCAAGRQDPLIRRFRFGLFAVMLVFLGRALAAVTGAGGWRAIEYLGAGLIPLAVLLLTEGLLRRHAPPWGKAIIGGGTLLGVILSVFPAALIDPPRILFLLVLQVGSFVLAGWLVLMRDRETLSVAENRAAERLALSLLLILPLGASDFLILFFDLPLRISGLAVLFLCWLAIGLWRGESERHRAPLLAFANMLACALAAAWVIALAAGMEREGWILSLALILAAVLLAAVIADGQSALRAAETPSILARLSRARGQDPVAFFRAMAGHPAVEGAVFVSERSLGGLDAATLDRLFDARPVLRRRDKAPVEPELSDLCVHLFERYEASHILEVRRGPRLLLALSLPSMTAGSRIETELDVAQRMAALMGGRDAE